MSLRGTLTRIVGDSLYCCKRLSRCADRCCCSAVSNALQAPPNSFAPDARLTKSIVTRTAAQWSCDDESLSAANMETELQELRSHNKQRGLQLQIDTEKQADIKLRRMAELQAATARQDDLELAQQEEILGRRQLMWNAQCGSALTAQVMSAATVSQNVQLTNIPFTLETQSQAVLSVSSTAEDSTVPTAQLSKVKKVLKDPDMFRAQTIDGRFKEWVGVGQYAGIKSLLVKNKKRLGIPPTGHSRAAVDNLRKKRCLPKAIEQLVVQGLSSDAAVALVTQVVTEFGLKSIYDQSEAFLELYIFEKAVAASKPHEVAKHETRTLCKTGKTVREFQVAYHQAKSEAFGFQVA